MDLFLRGLFQYGLLQSGQMVGSETESGSDWFTDFGHHTWLHLSYLKPVIFIIAMSRSKPRNGMYKRP